MRNGDVDVADHIALRDRSQHIVVIRTKGITTGTEPAKAGAFAIAVGEVRRTRTRFELRGTAEPARAVREVVRIQRKTEPAVVRAAVVVVEVAEILVVSAESDVVRQA